MSSSLLALAGLLIVLIIGLALASSASHVVRGVAVILCVLGCVTIVGYSAYGFLASGECADPTTRIAWRAGYIMVGLVSTGFATLLLWPRRRPL